MTGETLAYLEEMYQDLKAFGVLEPKNNPHLYEHLRGNPNYKAFCEHIYGKETSGGFSRQASETREKETPKNPERYAASVKTD